MGCRRRNNILARQCDLRLRCRRRPPSEYAAGDSVGTRVPRQRGRGRRQYRLHRVQLARHSDRQRWRTNERRRALHHRRHDSAWRHRNGDRPDWRLEYTSARRSAVEDLMRITLSSERGTTLIETMIALAILLVVMGGLITLSAMASKTTENNGHLAARTTEDAQDKMEQLLVLAYTNA